MTFLKRLSLGTIWCRCKIRKKYENCGCADNISIIIVGTGSGSNEVVVVAAAPVAVAAAALTVKTSRLIESVPAVSIVMVG